MSSALSGRPQSRRPPVVSRVGSYWSDLRGRREADLDLLAAVLGQQLAATLTRIAPLAG